MSIGRGARRVVLLASVVSLVLGACSSLSSPSPSPSPSPGEPLVTVELRGGLCITGTCDRTVTLQRDGHVREAAKPPNDLGTVAPAALATIDAAIRKTDFTELRRHPFTGECPTAFDGQEIVLEFAAPGGVERIASCEVEIDWRLPLFVAVATALGPFVPLPIASAAPS